MRNILKIFFILSIAFVSSKIIYQSVFVAGTPRLNTSFLLVLMNAPRNFLSSLNKVNVTTDRQKVALQKLDTLPVAALNQIGVGVYAKADKENKVVYIKITKDAEWEEHEINYEGKIIKVRFPKGSFK